MEKLDKVIAGLTGCIACICSNCEYYDPGCESGCTERLMADALEWLKALSEDLTGAHEEIHKLAKSLSAARSERNVLIREVEQLEMNLEVTRQNLGDTREELNRKTQSEFYESLRRGLEEAVAYEKGEIDLPTKTLSTDGDLISRSVLIEEVKCLCGNWFHGYQDAITHVVEEIEAVPVVEAEPVVHAHWECECEPYCFCSNCHHKFSLFDRVPRCPNCGAHMDEEVAHE